MLWYKVYLEWRLCMEWCILYQVRPEKLAYLYGFCYTLRILAELADVYQTIVWSFHMENNHLLDLFTWSQSAGRKQSCDPTRDTGPLLYLYGMTGGHTGAYQASKHTPKGCLTQRWTPAKYWPTHVHKRISLSLSAQWFSKHPLVFVFWE